MDLSEAVAVLREGVHPVDEYEGWRWRASDALRYSVDLAHGARYGKTGAERAAEAWCDRFDEALRVVLDHMEGDGR